MVALAPMGPSYQDVYLHQEFREQIMAGACLVEAEAEVGENLIFQEVIHQTAHWASSQVQAQWAVASAVAAEEPFWDDPLLLTGYCYQLRKQYLQTQYLVTFEASQVGEGVVEVRKAPELMMP